MLIAGSIDLVGLSRAEGSPLANWALCLLHEIEWHIEDAAQKNKNQPVELLRRNDIALAQGAING
jgi:hypothetical protein